MPDYRDPYNAESFERNNFTIEEYLPCIAQ